MTEGDVDIGRLAELIRLVETRGLKRLIVEENGCRYSIRGLGHAKSAGSANSAGEHAAPHADVGLNSAEAPVPDRSGWIAVVAPMVGVYYRAPAPGEPPFVSVGDPVEPGQIIGIIEAMKVFSEIPSEHEGRVVELVAEDGQLVRAGEPLIFLSPGPIHDHNSIEESSSNE